MSPADLRPVEVRQRDGWRRGMLASLLLHSAIILLLVGLWRPEPPPEIIFPEARIVLEGPGGEGAAKGGGGAMPSREGTTAKANSAPAETSSAPEPTQQTMQPSAETTAPLPPVPHRKPTPPTPPRVAQRSPPAPPAAQQSPTAPTASAPPPPGPSQGGLGGSRGVGAGARGAGEGAIGAGSGPGDDYLDRVRRHLQRFKRYPEAALKQKQEGVVTISIRLARDGTVLDVAVVQSSGFPLLDAAALQMVRDAAPLPPFPATYPPASGKITLPVRYELGFFQRLF